MRVPGDFLFTEQFSNLALNSTLQLHRSRRYDQKIYKSAADPNAEQLFTERHQEEKRRADGGRTWLRGGPFPGQGDGRGFGLWELLTAPLEMLVWNVITK